MEQKWALPTMDPLADVVGVQLLGENVAIGQNGGVVVVIAREQILPRRDQRVEVLAAELGISQRSFTEMLKLFGIRWNSVKVFIIQKWTAKLEHARSLLAQSPERKGGKIKVLIGKVQEFLEKLTSDLNAVSYSPEIPIKKLFTPASQRKAARLVEQVTNWHNLAHPCPDLVSDEEEPFGALVVPIGPSIPGATRTIAK